MGLDRGWRRRYRDRTQYGRPPWDEIGNRTRKCKGRREWKVEMETPSDSTRRSRRLLYPSVSHIVMIGPVRVVRLKTIEGRGGSPSCQKDKDQEIGSMS